MKHSLKNKFKMLFFVFVMTVFSSFTWASDCSQALSKPSNSNQKFSKDQFAKVISRPAMVLRLLEGSDKASINNLNRMAIELVEQTPFFANLNPGMKESGSKRFLQHAIAFSELRPFEDEAILSANNLAMNRLRGLAEANAALKYINSVSQDEAKKDIEQIRHYSQLVIAALTQSRYTQVGRSESLTYDQLERVQFLIADLMGRTSSILVKAPADLQYFSDILRRWLERLASIDSSTNGIEEFVMSVAEVNNIPFNEALQLLMTPAYWNKHLTGSHGGYISNPFKPVVRPGKFDAPTFPRWDGPGSTGSPSSGI